MKAGIVIDFWKLSIFERRLKRAGYAYEIKPGVTAETKTLTVVTEDVNALGVIVKAANSEAARTKGK